MTKGELLDKVEDAWRGLTREKEVPDDLIRWVDDVDTVVKYLGGDDHALRSTQVIALAVVLYWRMQSKGAKP